MGKEALYLVHAELESSYVDEWNVWHGREHVPLVVKTGGFIGASRMRHVLPGGELVDPPRFTTVYRAPGLGAVRTYLEGGDVGRMRAHHDAWLGDRKARLSREVLEENYSVGSDGKALVRTPELSEGRAAFVVRVRVDPELAPEWSVWYDGEHMPKAVAAGGFLRGGRWRIVDESVSAVRFAILYEASSLAVVASFRAGPGPSLSGEHEAKFGGRVVVEREVWTAG
jgi:hypothetical protein